MSSIKEIAQKVGISPASVSIYLNNKDTNRVSASTKKKIDKAVTDLNYHKNLFASSLSSDRSRIIGIIIPTVMSLFQNDYTNALLSGIQTSLSAQGYSLLFFPSSAKTSIEIVREQLENSAGCDGFILFSTGFCSLTQIQKNIRALKNTGRPFVTLNVPEVEEPVNQILIEGLCKAKGMRYLLNKGHRQVLLILGRPGGEHTKQIYNDCQNLVEQYNLPWRENLVQYGNYNGADALEITEKVLQKENDITAVCCMSDLMASGSVQALNKLGLRIPEDISVVGRNNSPYASFCTPGLTTLDLHMHEAGQNAAGLLLESLENKGISKKIIIASHMVERESVSGVTPDEN